MFPFWVTGAVTATGGAWNASIVAEVATWGNDKLVADGLGAYIAQVTEKGDSGRSISASLSWRCSWSSSIAYSGDGCTISRSEGFDWIDTWWRR